ncbi:MAG: ATPase [Halomonadaceae bacterium]|nr:MAG: ATPase [Halomonadaceae bacterium]
MKVRTVYELIEWTRMLHHHLAACLAECSTKNEEERAQALLEYLADHERKMEQVVAEFERKADPRALKTYVYDWIEHKLIETHRTCDAHYAKLSFAEICREVFDFHDQVIDLYQDLVERSEIPEVQELMQSLLDMEKHQAMRLVRQTGRMDDL